MNIEQKIPDWNKDGIWINVETKLHQKKKKISLLWWFSGLASIAFLFGIITWNTSFHFDEMLSERSYLPKKEQINIAIEKPTNIIKEQIAKQRTVKNSLSKHLAFASKTVEYNNERFNFKKSQIFHNKNNSKLSLDSGIVDKSNEQNKKLVE